jgi:anti-sigma factor RsiW
MSCSRDLIEAYLDGELDAAQHALVQQHMTGCPNCSEAYARLSRQKADIKAVAPYYSAPPDLQRSVLQGLQRLESEAVKPVRELPWRWVAIAASILLVASLSWNVIQMRPRVAEGDLADIILTDHIRSLIGTRLVDVPSSDQHTVKPWFAGKLEFAPDVRDLSAQGFPLMGGRVEYLDGRRVAALVYQRRMHVINLFIWPAGSAAGPETAVSRNGYNLIHWTTGPMTYWAVSDLNAGELATLRSLYK